METSGGAKTVILNKEVIWAVAMVCWVQTDTERTHQARALLLRGTSAKRLPETPLRCPARIRSAPAGGGSGGEAGQAGVLPLKPPDRASCPVLLRKNQRRRRDPHRAVSDGLKGGPRRGSKPGGQSTRGPSHRPSSS